MKRRGGLLELLDSMRVYRILPTLMIVLVAASFSNLINIDISHNNILLCVCNDCFVI